MRNTLLNTLTNLNAFTPCPPSRKARQEIEHDILTNNSFHKYVFFKSATKFSNTLKNHNNVKCGMYNFSMKTQHP